MFWGDDMNVEKNMFTTVKAKINGIQEKHIELRSKRMITPDVKDGQKRKIVIIP